MIEDMDTDKDSLVSKEEFNAFVLSQTRYTNALAVQARERFKLIKFIFVCFGTSTVFLLLTALTGISYEFNEETGSRLTYKSPGISDEIIKLIVPIVGTVLTAVVTSQLKQSGIQSSTIAPESVKNNVNVK